jgi:hypothetical protein
LGNQDDGLIWNSMPGYGFVYKISFPFALLGIIINLIIVIRNKFKKFYGQFFILVWLFLSIILGLLIDVNVNRINVLFLPLIFFAASGIIYFCFFIKFHFLKGKLSKFMLPSVIIIYFLFFISFSCAYFKTYSEKIGPSFFESFGGAINYAVEIDNQPICVTNQVNMSYIFVLFYRQIDPNIFVKTVKYMNPGGEYQWVLSFDRYNFGIENCIKSSKRMVYIFHNSEEDEYFSPNKYLITRFKNYSVAVLKSLNSP